MEITIELGDDEIQKQIKEELDFILIIAEQIRPPLSISKILIPIDFQAKVRELTGDNEYKFKRGLENAQIMVAAKILEDSDGIIIVISPHLYLPLFDSMVRCFILAHEFAHLLNKRKFPEIPKDSFARENYLGNLYFFFDEYRADRIAFQLTEVLFPSPTEAWKQHRDNEVLDYINPSSHPSYYEQIKIEIEKFRNHADVNLFWKSIHETSHVVSVSTVHGFAAYHQYEDEYQDLEIPSTPFVNEKTLALMEYFRAKYEKKDTELSDGIDLISDYMTNFGVRFEDRPNNQGYIYVLDI